MYNKLLKITIFIMIFTASLVSVQLGGISLNKIGMIPFFLFLILSEKEKKEKIVINKNTIILFMLFVFSICSSVFSILNPITENKAIFSAQLNFIIQNLVFYIPILLMVSNSNNRNIITTTFFEELVKVIRIHAIFIIVQFIIYTSFHINISSLLFDDLLGGITGNNWTSHIYGNHILIRASGLNYDPAFASYLMICGIVFDNNKFSKYIYLLCTLLSQSRTGLLAAIILLLLKFLLGDKKIKINIKKLICSIVLILVCIIVINNNFIQMYIGEIFDRIIDIFLNNDSKNISTLRHTSYPWLAIQSFFSSSGNILNKLFGVGPRMSGLALMEYTNEYGISFEYNTNMENNLWSIECDFADILLGCGIFGLIIYYIQLLSFLLKKDNKIKVFAIILAIMGFMYNFAFTTINMLVFIFLVNSIINKNNGVDFNEKGCDNINQL